MHLRQSINRRQDEVKRSMHTKANEKKGMSYSASSKAEPILIAHSPLCCGNDDDDI